MLEEVGMPYTAHPVSIGKDEQFAPDFLKISPNNKIPAIVDDAGLDGPLAIFESGAILTYLAEKSGRFLAPSGPARYKALEWLHWQIGGLGPMLGQLGFFAKRSPGRNPGATERVGQEMGRLVGGLGRRPGEGEYLGGGYSIAGNAPQPWVTGGTRLPRAFLG